MPFTLGNRIQAGKFLYRATFGPKKEDIDQLINIGVESWLEQQFNAPPQLHLELARRYAEITGNKKTNSLCRKGAWWCRTLSSKDPLRQRVAFALSQILVVSKYNGGPSNDEALLTYYDLLLNHAFGNFRELLEQVTLNPAMGTFLSLDGSKKADPKKSSYPDENFAREVMQLFTIGLWKLANNGLPVSDINNDPVPSYSQQDVEEMARVLTGWTKSDYLRPMHSIPDDHDFGQKQVFNEIFPAGQTPEQDLSQAMDLLFNHPNTPIFVSTLLIKRLTISNPRRVYINRVAETFKDNGKGVRGDLKAVIKAILLDSDVMEGKAMSDYQTTGRSTSNFGKVKEPLVAMANLARALNAESNDKSRWWDFPDLDNNNFGQAPLEAPSVFNFYEADYAPKGEISDKELYSPEFNILNMDTFRTISNRMWALIEAPYHGGHRRGWRWDRSEFEQALENPGQYVDLLSQRFFGDDMPVSLSEYLNAMLRDSEQSGYTSDRTIKDTLFAIQCSPEFRCQGVKKMKFSRRNFLKGGLASGASLVLPAVSGINPAYGSSDGFKALVCIFLQGGNDAYNMVIPASSQEYNLYQSMRPNMAVARNKLVDTGLMADNHVPLGLHSAMASLHPVFKAGNATVIVNSGQLVEPVIGKTNPRIPPFVMAHNYQSILWESGTMSYDNEFGWAGRMADDMYLNGTLSPLISINGERKWLRSRSLGQLVIRPEQPSGYEGMDTPEKLRALDRHFTNHYSNLFQRNYSQAMETAYLDHMTLKGYLDELGSTGPYPDTDLGHSLQSAAQYIRIRGKLGHQRQVYYIGLGGFDSHKDQAKSHEKLLQTLSDAMAAFQADIDSTGLSDQVTTFTMSDFGRRIVSNATGTDHGWGGHQLIMGGAVKGGKAYGTWPDLSPGSPYDYKNSRMIPEIAADQVSATLATWFGYPKSPENLFPSLNNGFNRKTLDFLTTGSALII